MNRKVIKITISETAHQKLGEYAKANRLNYSRSINRIVQSVDGDIVFLRSYNKPDKDKKSWSYLWTPETPELYDWAKEQADQRRLSALIEGILLKMHDPNYLGMLVQGEPDGK